MNREEQKECINFYKWFCLQYPHFKGVMNHSPNEGKRSVIAGHLLKLMGMQRGWPDYQLCVPSTPYSGLFIEMKLKQHKNRKKPTHQTEKLKLLTEMGYYCTYAHGFDEAKEIVENYLKHPAEVPEVSFEL